MLVGRIWLKFLAEVSFFVYQPLKGSNFRTSCPIWMNNPLLEGFYVVVFKYLLCVWSSFMWYFCCRQFFTDFRKNMQCSFIQPHSTPLDVFGILIGHQCVISMQISQKAKKSGLDHIQGISDSKLEKKMFFSKHLNNH